VDDLSDKERDSFVKRTLRGLGAFLGRQWTRERTSLRFDWGFLGLVGFYGLLLAVMPSPASDPFELDVPADGSVVATALPLERGRLYKVTVGGVYRYRFGSLADAQFRSSEGESFDVLFPTVVINDRLARAQHRDIERHRYTFYIAGEGVPLTARIYDFWDRGFGDEVIPYWDNAGRLVLNVREADFRCRPLPAPARDGRPLYLIHYDLDPVPEPTDTVTLRVWRLDDELDEGRELVFLADTDQPVESYGDRRYLGREGANDFGWFGTANLGRFRDHPVPFGDYLAEVRVESAGRSFSTVDWSDPDDAVHLAVLPTAEDPDGPFRLERLTDAEGRDLYGYKPPRALTPVLGPAEVAATHPDFPCLAHQPGLTDAPGYHSPVLAHLKRRLNLALTTAAELDGVGFTPCGDVDGQFDEELVRLLGAFRERFPFADPAAEAFLRRYGNLAGELGEGPVPAELLSRVVSPAVFAALNELRFSLPGLPGEWTLDDFDNLPFYDADNPRRSLYHRFAELAARFNAARPDGEPHPGFLETDQRELLLNPRARYDIADGAFRAFCQAVSYQECGLMHVLGSGRSYRAAYGHGSATGYMQLTGDPVRSGSYQLFYDVDGEPVRVGFPSLPVETRYDLRYINELNLQVGVQYLKLVLASQSRWEFDPRCRDAYRPGGVLDFTTRWGTTLRLKLAGAMYNAGPYGVKVILRDVYSTIPPPPDGVGEAAWYRDQLAAIDSAPPGPVDEDEAESAAEPDAAFRDDPAASVDTAQAAELESVPADFPWSAPPSYEMDYPGMPGLDYFYGPCGGDIEPFLIRFALDLRRYLAGDYNFPCESYPGGRERLYQIFKMLGPFWINRGAGGDWARAALMKLEREVIGYVRGMERNVPLFWDYGEEIFRDQEFGRLSSQGKTRAEIAGDEPAAAETEEPSSDEPDDPIGVTHNPEEALLPEVRRHPTPSNEEGDDGDPDE
jgi:hypothetical protein